MLNKIKEEYARSLRTEDLSLSAVHLCIKSAMLTSTVPSMGGAGTNWPLTFFTCESKSASQSFHHKKPTWLEQDISVKNREEKSLRHVAMVAKFLDDNTPKTSLKKWICTVSNFIDLILFHLICQMLANVSGIESERIVSKLRKRKRFLCCVHLVLHKAGA